jgi:hypothetical protein
MLELYLYWRVHRCVGLRREWVCLVGSSDFGLTLVNCGEVSKNTAWRDMKNTLLLSWEQLMTLARAYRGYLELHHVEPASGFDHGWNCEWYVRQGQTKTSLAARNRDVRWKPASGVFMDRVVMVLDLCDFDLSDGHWVDKMMAPSSFRDGALGYFPILDRFWTWWSRSCGAPWFHMDSERWWCDLQRNRAKKWTPKAAKMRFKTIFEDLYSCVFTVIHKY